MGREYRLSRNPRLRQAGDRRPAGIPDALSLAHGLQRCDAAAGPIVEPSSDRQTVGSFIGPLTGPFIGPFVGIDVGEDFLDLAIVGTPPHTLVFKRITLGGLKGSACATLAERIGDAVPGVDTGAIALVDSPRWPRDLDWSRETRRRYPAPQGREIDTVLRQIFRTLTTAPTGKARTPGLSMFPTPRYDYFARCARDPRCKPHLKAIAAEVFDEVLNDDDDARESAPGGGGTFTRFMLAGFATYRALERLGVPAFESYPDLQLRLSSPSAELPPKRQRAEALAARRHIVASLAGGLGLRDSPVAANLDQADAAVLALAAASSARRGALWMVSNSSEGHFMLALDSNQVQILMDPALPALGEDKVRSGHG